MAELVLGPVMEKLSGVILEYLKDQVKRQKGMQEEVQKLQQIQPQIKAVMSAYRQVEIKNLDLNKWYWQLRDAVEEADDVLDEIEYRKLRKQASKNNKTGKVGSLMKSMSKRFVEISKRAIKIDSYLERLEVAVQNLSEISAKVSEFIHLVDITKQEQQQQRLQLLRTRETGAMLGNDFVGRSDEITRVKDWLRNSYETQSIDTADLYRNISVLSVVGHGGMGKTTLLQHVYDEDATTLFDVKMWVCVSTNFDAKTVIKNILESVENRRPDQESLHSLQTSLRSKMTSQRFLLVLDDIWEEGDGKWENVLSPLQYGSYGSKILISTRIPSVAYTFANMIKNNQILKLEGLEKDGCLHLFNKYAFAGRENPGGNFADIAKKMVERLSRCPLAVKFIANFLNTCVDEAFWTNVLNTSVANIKSADNGLLAILKLSYTNLPDHLQNCFSFCCIFPQDHEFDKDDLVRMWIAVGFIQSPDIPGETLENTGRRYFNILVKNSFFDEFHADDYRVYYKMHDLLHDLARSVSIQECSRVIADDKNMSIPDTIRHLSIHCSSLEVLKMKKLKNLRSLIIYHTDFEDGFDENLISQILKASESLRLLVICLPCNYFRPHRVSEMIDSLIHLRYLKAHYGFLKPSRSFSHLYHLQFVICQRWLPDLPSSVMYLDIQDILEQECLPSLSAISSLNHLAFYNNNLLKSLPDLPSSLKKLDICKVHTLQCLPSSLSAISSLNHLTIKNNWWLESLSDLPSSLKKLVLCNLSGLNCLPSSLSAISSLETLALGKIPQLKSLPKLPSSLMHLHLIELENLDCMPSCLPTRLHELRIEKVPRLRELPEFPASLEVLYIEDCDPLLMERCESFRKGKAE